ncbi:TRAP transporter small permease [Sedimentitalea sp. JM2-8]|uniref:TRAP transporter small permease protein n=1 Tax=Sedimentitalea xiamensis TaxID=3050037 RepID=A0ABT7FIZ1_9RHOB|nr:TRAP transporter small permease [Sedimentitalea xiamensis]MDK3075000.1 TRAP transporter small permease [Sedimentitalea xiamensis]
MTSRIDDEALGASSMPAIIRHRLGGFSLETFAAFAARLFGIALVALSLFVSVETVVRKLFNFSFEGADELGGYVLAVGSSLAFVVALVDRAHIRIDILHSRFPKRYQAIMDWLSIVSVAVLGLFILYVGRIVIVDTMAYGSTAPTPWATPLIWPQAAWYGALCLFALTAIYLAIRATVHVINGRLDQVSAEFHPKGAIEELEEEMSDLKRR